MNGDIWDAVNELRKDVRMIAVDGCAHKPSHDSLFDLLREERHERMKALEDLSDEMKSMRNQILVGIGIVMAIALVVDKILK